MNKPIIGIVEWPYFDKDDDKIYEVVNEMVEKVSLSGGIPIGIFPTQIEKFQLKKLDEILELTGIEKQDLNESLNMCDAIIKPGALKIYGFERYIYDYAFCKDVPYLGVCAGMQMMSNSINIKNEDKGINHRSSDIYAHKIKILRDSILYEILDQDEIMVNSRHSYHISDPGINSVSAYSEDGIIEAIENRSKQFQIGLQWHPETINDDNSIKIFDRLIEESNIYKCKKKLK